MEFKFFYMYISMILCVRLYVSHAQEGTACENEGAFFHNTQDCSTYFWCVNGIMLKMPCADGLEFNLAWRTCVWPGQSDCLTIEKRCEQDSTAIIPHPTECQLFYDCSIVYGPGPRVFEQHMDECYYPDYFSVETMTCESFEVVDCGSRNKNIDACSYRRSGCPVAHCQPCFVGSCRGFTDGLHANDKRLWSPYYTNCYKERAIESLECPHDSDGRRQFFHPCLEMCVPLYLIPREYEGTMPLCNDESDGLYDDVIWSTVATNMQNAEGIDLLTTARYLISCTTGDGGEK